MLTIALWWLEWALLDWIWKGVLGLTVVTFIGWIFARYRASPNQREMKGALFGLAGAAILTMFLALTLRPVARAPAIATSAVQLHSAEPILPDIFLENISQLIGIVLAIPRPCQFRITAPAKNQPLRQFIRQILTASVPRLGNVAYPTGQGVGIPSCRIMADEKDSHPEFYSDFDHPTVYPAERVIVHWKPVQPAGEFVAEWLASAGLKISRGTNLPPNSSPDLIYIEIGNGSVWKK